MPSKRTNVELYKRHAGCPVLEKPKGQRDYFFNCECNFYMRGFLPSGKQIDRKSTGTNDLKTAESEMDSLVRVDMASCKQEQIHGKTIDACVGYYLDGWADSVSRDTLGTHTYVLNTFQSFCARSNVHYMNQLNAQILDQFKKAFPGVSHNSLSIYMSKFYCFLKEAYRLGWLTTPLVLTVKKPAQFYDGVGKPFTTDDMILIKHEVLNTKRLPRYGYSHRPKTALVMVDLQRETGLRISDTIQFDPARLTLTPRGTFRYRYVPQKGRRVNRPLKYHNVFLQPELVRRIRECEWMSPELPFSFKPVGKSDKPLFETLGGQFYDLMQATGERAGVDDCRPHRLRDTFAIEFLNNGGTIAQLSKLLGHQSEKVTRDHYAPESVEQDALLEEAMMAAHVRAAAGICLSPK